MKIKILIPVYNDWQSLSKLIDEINQLSINSDYKILMMPQPTIGQMRK